MQHNQQLIRNLEWQKQMKDEHIFKLKIYIEKL